METWPASLPKPQKKFNAQLRSGLADDQEQINSQRTRTYPERESNFSLILTQAQFETLWTFYETTLNGGGILFEADWLTEAGFTFHRLRFLKPFEASLNGGMMWEVKMNLEIITGVPFDGADPAYWPCSPAIPSPPANVQASDGTFTDKVQITWTASSGATSYEVYRADTESGDKTLKGSPEITSFDDTTAVAPTVYYYWVKAVNASGASGFSSFDTGWRDEGLPDEYGYIYGGYSTSNLQDCDQYTPDTWTSKTDMPAPGRAHLAASTIGSSGYVHGGHDGSAQLQDCDQYTPDTWTSKTDMPAPARHGLAASTIGSSGYIYGGWDGSNPLQDCDGYTPDTWTSKSNMPLSARYILSASTIGSSGYIYGGYSTSNLQDCDQYTPDTWTSKTDMPAPARRQLSASTIGSSGYVHGGWDGINYFQDCDQYTPDTWTSKTDMPAPARRQLSASTIGSSGYIYGGWDGSNPLQDCDGYTPDTWTSKSNMPAPARRNLAASTI